MPALLPSRWWGVVLIAASSGSLMLWPQNSQLSPRELFYREQTAVHNQHAASSVKSHAPVKSTPAPPSTASSSTASPPTPGNVQSNALLTETSAAAKSNPEVSHLGLRYSLLLVDTHTAEAKPVSSTQTFDQGQCFGLEFQANRSGYLYVFNLGSSGSWKALLPTPQMPEEGNFVPAFTSLRVPTSHCYRISGPAGEEHLFVVLSRNPQDVDELNRSIRSGHGPGAPPSPDPSAAISTLASNLNQAVQKIASLKGRDLEVEEVGGVKNLAENSPAVYVVHTSDTPSDKVMTEIKIVHR